MSSYGRISLKNSSLATYISSDAPFAPASVAPTDIWSIYGADGYVIKILKLGIYVGSSATGYFVGYLLRRSTTNTGGTSTTTTATKADPDNASPQAIVRAYTANPSALGTSAGQILHWSQYPALYNAVGSTEEAHGVPYWKLWDANLAGQPLILRDADHGIVINCNGVANALTSGRVSVHCIWTEEAV
jgi:hypothetical protein